jgi:hypothetical protein
MQEFTSAKTSVNTLARGFRVMEHKPFSTNLDLGGGKFSQGSDFLGFYGIKNLILDPFNQAPDHNEAVLKRLWAHPADTGTCFNVLNVIKESEVRVYCLETLKCMVKRGGMIYVQVYRGKGDTPKATRHGWQENRPLATYLDEIRQVFPTFGIRRNIVEILNP